MAACVPGFALAAVVGEAVWLAVVGEADSVTVGLAVAFEPPPPQPVSRSRLTPTATVTRTIMGSWHQASTTRNRDQGPDRRSSGRSAIVGGVAEPSDGGRRVFRVLLGAFLVAHGLVHVAMWAPRYDPEKAPFDASRSWLIGDRRTFAKILAFSAAAALVVAGLSLWVGAGWWRPTAVVGLGVSTLLLLVYFNRWYLFILAVNVVLIVGIGWMDWPSRSAVGALLGS